MEANEPGDSQSRVEAVRDEAVLIAERHPVDAENRRRARGLVRALAGWRVSGGLSGAEIHEQDPHTAAHKHGRGSAHDHFEVVGMRGNGKNVVSVAHGAGARSPTSTSTAIPSRTLAVTTQKSSKSSRHRGTRSC